jgi:hypothetical protein
MDQGILTLATVAVTAVVAALVLWVLYTVTWRAVRRGMREFEFAHVATASVRATASAPGPMAPEHHRFQLHLPRRVPADVAPDYPPSEWF